MSAPTLGSVLSGFAKEAPDLVGRIGEALSEAGFPLDLGPMTPDVRARFEQLTADAREELRKKFHPNG